MQEGTHRLGAGRTVGRSPFRKHQVRQDEAQAARASQPRRSGQLRLPRGNHSPETVVPLHSVPTTWTGSGVVPEAVSSSVAQWAEAVGACDREPEPHTEKNPKEGGFQVQSQGLGRAGGQPGASTGLLQKLQVGSLCFAGGRNGQLGQLGFVQAGGKVLLSGRANRRSSDAIGSQHGSVEPFTEAAVVGQSVA